MCIQAWRSPVELCKDISYVGKHLPGKMKGATILPWAYSSYTAKNRIWWVVHTPAKLWWVDSGFHPRNIKRGRLVGKIVTNYQSFVRFIKLFHHQTFVLCDIIYLVSHVIWIFKVIMHACIYWISKTAHPIYALH